MSLLLQDLDGPYQDPTPSSWDAVVLDTATTDGQPVRVKVPDISPDLSWGPCPWTARPGGGRPARGDSAVVVFTSTSTPIIVQWGS